MGGTYIDVSVYVTQRGGGRVFFFIPWRLLRKSRTRIREKNMRQERYEKATSFLLIRRDLPCCQVVRVIEAIEILLRETTGETRQTKTARKENEMKRARENIREW